MSVAILALGAALIWWIVPFGDQSQTADAPVEPTVAPTEQVAAALAPQDEVSPTATLTLEPLPSVTPTAAATEPVVTVEAEEAEAAVAEAPEPETEQGPDPEPENIVHTVASGDVLGRIAIQYDIPLADLLEANGIGENATLQIGQELVIPQTAAEPQAEISDDNPETEPAPVATAAPQVHVVSNGDTLNSIASRYGVPVAEIAAANSISLNAVLSVDQELVIPQPTPVPTETDAPTATETPMVTPTALETAAPTATPTPAPTDVATSGPVVHTVAQGDTLGSIAVQYNVASAEIAAANNISLNSTLRIGQELVIPGTTAEPEESQEEVEEAQPEVQRTSQPTEEPLATSVPQVHTVVQGDTLGGIAVQYGVSSQEIAAANNIPLNSTLRLGQQLTIPGTAAEPTATVTPTPEPTLDPAFDPAARPTPTPVPLRTPAVRYPYSAPILLTPINATTVVGSTKGPMLQWTSVGILARDEWYLVRLWTPEDGEAPTERLTKATSWRVPKELYPEGRRANRFTWQVSVVRLIDRAPGQQVLSPASVIYGFSWR